MKVHDIIMNKNNQIQSIELEISILIVTQYTNYDYNNEFWDFI